MSAARPRPRLQWYRRDCEAMLDLARRMKNPEAFGVLSSLIDLFCRQGGRLPADDGFVSGNVGLSAQKWRVIKGRLVDQGFLALDGDSFTIPIAEEVYSEGADRYRDKSRAGQLSAAARRAAKSELQGEAGGSSAPTPRASGGLLPDQSHYRCNDLSELGATPVQQPLQPATETYTDTEESTATAEPQSPGHARTRDAPAIDYQERRDLLGITNRLARLGGVSLHRETARIAAMDLVKGWIAEGIDIEATAIPAIEEQRRDTKEKSIGSLAFYAGRIAKRHADAIDQGNVPQKPMTPKEIEAQTRKTVALYRRIGHDKEADLLERQLDQGAKRRGDSGSP